MSLPATLVLDTNCQIYRLDDPDSARGRWLELNVYRPAASGNLQVAVTAVARRSSWFGHTPTDMRAARVRYAGRSRHCRAYRAGYRSCPLPPS
ncbi:MAG: hypothetical protein NVS3B26_31070 [Mycobacteriales bacterium]